MKLLLVTFSILFISLRGSHGCQLISQLGTHSITDYLSTARALAAIRTAAMSSYSPHELVSISVDGAPCLGFLHDWTLYARSHSTDFQVIEQVMGANEFSFLNTVYPDQNASLNILDLGGNAGYVALTLGHMYPKAHVVTVEPTMTSHSLIQINTRPYQNVVAEHAAVWGKNAVMRTRRVDVNNVEDVGYGREWGLVVEEVENPEKLHISGLYPGFRVETLLDRHGMQYADFIKIDIESGERSLFDPKSDPLRWLARVRCLSLEIHYSALPSDWETSVLVPMMQSANFVMHGKFGEGLQLWCAKHR